MQLTYGRYAEGRNVEDAGFYAAWIEGGRLKKEGVKAGEFYRGIKPNKRTTPRFIGQFVRNFGYQLDADPHVERPMGGRYVNMVTGVRNLTLRNHYIEVFMNLYPERTFYSGGEISDRSRKSNIYDELKPEKIITRAFVENHIREITL